MKRFVGQKFFDSGDYQMAKQKGRVVGGRMAMPVLAQPPTGEAHPTPDTVPGTYDHTVFTECVMT